MLGFSSYNLIKIKLADEVLKVKALFQLFVPGSLSWISICLIVDGFGSEII